MPVELSENSLQNLLYSSFWDIVWFGYIDELGPCSATRLRPSMTDMSLGHCVKYAGKSAGAIPPSATDSESCTYISDPHFLTIIPFSIFFSYKPRKARN